MYSDRKRIFLIFPSWCFMYWFVIIGAGIFLEGYYLEGMDQSEEDRVRKRQIDGKSI